MIYTIGHSVRPLEDLFALLREHAVQVVADVRTVPRSRRSPQFTRDALAVSLPAAGIGYTHVPALGGLRHPSASSPNLGWENPSFRGFADYMGTVEFDIALSELMELAALRRTAIMCAEAVPWRCHRSLISDALTARGEQVVHIVGPGRAGPHRMTLFAVAENGRVNLSGARLRRPRGGPLVLTA